MRWRADWSRLLVIRFEPQSLDVDLALFLDQIEKDPLVARAEKADPDIENSQRHAKFRPVRTDLSRISGSVRLGVKRETKTGSANSQTPIEASTNVGSGGTESDNAPENLVYR